jgi:DNA-binding FrmR family transcriptional regulator
MTKQAAQRDPSEPIVLPHDGPHMDSVTKKDALKRINYIAGHLDGVRKMIEQDVYCVDVMKQTYALRRALQKLDAVLLNNHLHHCVTGGIKDGREEQIVEELLQVYTLGEK